MFVLRRIYHGLGDFDSQVDRYVKSTDNKYVLIKASRTCIRFHFDIFFLVCSFHKFAAIFYVKLLKTFTNTFVYMFMDSYCQNWLPFYSC